MDIKIAIYLLVVHFIADFVLQTNEQANNKSISIWYLLEHTISYSIVFWLALVIIEGFTIKSFMFYNITLVSHTITDYFTSKGTRHLWMKVTIWDQPVVRSCFPPEVIKKRRGNCVHNFFVLIGFDQLLHISQLLLTYYFLF